MRNCSISATSPALPLTSLFQTARQSAWLGLLALCMFAASSLAFANLGSSNNFNTTPSAPSTSGLSSTVTTSSANEFLPVDEAFQLSSWRENSGRISLSWQLAPDYYLYKHRFAVAQLREGVFQPLTLPLEPGQPKHDEYFGEVEVYYQQLITLLPAEATSGILKIEYQGCAEAGLCYPPQTRYLTASGDSLSLSENPPQQAQRPQTQVPVTEQQSFIELLTNASLGKVLGLFFLAGLALTFTPCVLPMVPILSSIIVKQQDQADRNPRSKAFILSLVYVLAMAATYAVAGSITGYFGAEMNVQAMLQAPSALVIFAALFLLLALAMFGFYELKLPAALENRLHNLSSQQQGGTYAGVAIMGMPPPVTLH